LVYTVNSLVAGSKSIGFPRKLKFNPVDLSVYAVTDSSLNVKFGHTMEEVGKNKKRRIEKCVKLRKYAMIR
jgi:hypothetical protein